MTPESTPALDTSRAALAVLAAGFALFVASGGCDHGSPPPDASPIVDANSEQGKKALAESEQLLKLRQQQEATARRRNRGLPDEG
ncbi:hypothetical protein TA3x_004624 [Tundrisphaera sp. TA3]|uniref:hypothetical protein n=1 Tax=Tundrisphaera sp. TA3 TaxID=3435775 RepID=UPI003EBD2CDE